MDINECLKKSLLKKDRPDMERAKKSLVMANHKLDNAKKLLKVGMVEETVTSAYAAMFHAARAVLFRDGFTEKSHYALFLYINEKYGSRIEKRFINELNTLRLERHQVQYGLEKQEIDPVDAQEILVTTKEFIIQMKNLIS